MKQRGVTLIELLVSVSILVVLGGLALVVFNPDSSRSKARDAKRVDDINLIKSALELYLTDNGTYPICAWEEVGPGTCLTTALTHTTLGSLNSVPVDPKGGSVDTATPCVNNASDNYRYNYRSTGGIYILTAILENPAQTAGHTCTVTHLSNWSGFPGALGCGTAIAGCYGLQNPQ